MESKGDCFMLKVGVIGLGNIAQKAYLPVYSKLQDQFEWHLMTRNGAKLAQIQKRYGFQHGTTNQDDLISAGVDAVFIHTPTPTHYQIIKKFLSHKIHVFVDKPISEDLDEVKELYQLAEQNQVFLTAGFNRRFVPMVQQLADHKLLHSIRATKTRENETQETNFAIFDLMIHVIDLVQFLMGSKGVELLNGRIVEKNGNLVSAEVQLGHGQLSGMAQVDMMANANTEVLQTTGQNGIMEVEDLNQLTIQKRGQKLVQKTPDWQENLETRGFKPLIELFLKAIVNGEENPVSPASSILSHELCVRLINETKVIK